MIFKLFCCIAQKRCSCIGFDPQTSVYSPATKLSNFFVCNDIARWFVVFFFVLCGTLFRAKQMPISPWLKLLPTLLTWHFFVFGSCLVSTSVRTVFGRVGCGVRISGLKTFPTNKALFDFAVNIMTFHGLIIPRHPKSGKSGEGRHFVGRTVRLLDRVPIQRRRLFAIQASVHQGFHRLLLRTKQVH